MMEFITVEQTAKELHLTAHTVRRMIRDGKIPAKKLGKSYRIDNKTLALILQPSELRVSPEPAEDIFIIAKRVYDACKLSGIAITAEQALQMAKSIRDRGII